jgi:hypothetical protein
VVDHKYRMIPNIVCCNPRNNPPFVNGWYGLLKQSNWDSDGKCAMAKELGSGRICGWAHVLWLYRTGVYILLFVSKERLYIMFGWGQLKVLF